MRNFSPEGGKVLRKTSERGPYLLRTDSRISDQMRRWIKAGCAYPVGDTTVNPRGIRGAKAIKINKSLYDSCIDPIDYRTKIVVR